MKLVLLLALLLSALAASPSAGQTPQPRDAQTAARFARCRAFALPGNAPFAAVYWTVDPAAGRVAFAMRGYTTGWIALGLGADGSMPSTDTIIGAVSVSNGALTLGDYYITSGSNARVACTGGTTGVCLDTVLGGTDDITRVAHRVEANAVVHIEFNRSLTSADTRDVNINSLQTYLLMAIGQDGQLLPSSFHPFRSNLAVRLDNANALCTPSCTGTETCVGGCCVEPASAPCTPNITSCPNPVTMCGNIDNGCGQSVGCGSCTQAHEVCTSNRCDCRVHTCAEHAWTCGTWTDGCAGVLNCGNCTLPQTCQEGRCLSCTPQIQCPAASEGGCGILTTACVENATQTMTLDCGSCRDATCNLNTNLCECSPMTVAQACTGGFCDLTSDGCGGNVYCGPCSCPPDGREWVRGANGNVGSCLCPEGTAYDLSVNRCENVAADNDVSSSGGENVDALGLGETVTYIIIAAAILCCILIIALVVYLVRRNKD